MATAGRVWKSRRDWILFWNFNRRRLRCRSLTVKVPRSDLVCRRLSLARMLSCCLALQQSHTHTPTCQCECRVDVRSLRTPALYNTSDRHSCARVAWRKCDSLCCLKGAAAKQHAASSAPRGAVQLAAWAARWRRGAWGGVPMSVPCGVHAAPTLAPRPTSVFQAKLALACHAWAWTASACLLACKSNASNASHATHAIHASRRSFDVARNQPNARRGRRELHEIGGCTPTTQSRRVALRLCVCVCQEERTKKSTWSP